MRIPSRAPTRAPDAEFSWITPELEENVAVVAGKLSDEEKSLLLSGADMWTLRPLPAHDLAPTRMADCGHGVTQTANRREPSTCFPTGIAMASTWSEAVIEEAGRAIAADCKKQQVDILLGPMINLHRVPVNGRSFETFSEDPYLAGILGAAEICGLQAAGIGACVKSVVANNQQYMQHTTSVEVDEKTLREMYLRTFEIAVHAGAPVAIMTSYNPLRGEQTAESRRLLRDVIKNDWKFPGFIVSDWRAVRSPAVYQSGLDLEMPGPGKWLGPQQLTAALADGAMSRADMEDRVSRMIRARLACANGLTGARDDHADAAAAGSADLEAAGPVDPADVARRVAEESIILLKNNGVLPFDRSTIKRLAVIGPNAAEARLGGGGSASVSPPYAVSPLEGIRSLARDEIHVEYAEGCGLLGDMEVIREGVSYGDTRGFRARFFGSPEPEGEVLWEGAVPQIDFSWGWSAPAPGVGGSQYSVEFCGEMQIEETGEYTFSLIGQEGPIRMWIADELVVDDWFGEREKQNLEAEFEVRHREVRRFLSAGDRVGVTVHYAKRSPRAAVRLEWRKPGGTEGAKAAVEVAAAADAVVLCLGLSNVFEGGTHDRASLDLPPSQIELISAVADANPNTIAILVNGGPVLCPWVDDVAALLEAWYPGQEGGTALARILFGHVNPSGRLPDTIGRSWDDYKALGNYPGDGTQVHYAEGCSVGYRHFDAAGLEPRFPFGFGLSYTAFSISLPELSDPVVFPDSSITVSVTATNTGRRVGRCVVQLYVGRIGSSDRPIRELRNFAKVELEPGDGKTVDFQLSWWDLAEWDTRENAWRVVEGRYAVGVGEHSRALSETELQATTRSPQDSAPSR